MAYRKKSFRRGARKGFAKKSSRGFASRGATQHTVRIVLEAPSAGNAGVPLGMKPVTAAPKKAQF